MQVIILAAGLGTRMAPLTDTTPKPMLTVLGKNLIEWKLERLPSGVTSILIVVGYKREQIENYFGNSWNGIPIQYVVDASLSGTGGAVNACREHVKDRALVLMGDDIYSKEDLEALSKHPFAMLVQDGGQEALTKKGQVVARDGMLHGLNEGLMQTGIPSTLINTGACSISKEYFNYPPVKVSEKEFGLPHTLVSVKNDIPIHIVETTEWIQITTPQCLKDAEARLA